MNKDREVRNLVELQWCAVLALLLELVGDVQEFPVVIFNIL